MARRWQGGQPREAIPPTLGQPAGLQGAGESDGLWRDKRGADLELDLGVGVEGDVARVAHISLAVVDGDDPTRGRAHLTRPERLAPLVEEVAEGEGAMDRGLDMDDPVRVVAVQPVQAGPQDSDVRRDLAWRASHEDGQVGVDVEGGLLAGLAADAVDLRPGGTGSGAGQRRGGRDR